MVASLMTLELEQVKLLDTESFGKLWLNYSIEYKTTVDEPYSMETITKLISTQWKFYIVQVIGQEFIAAQQKRNQILLHGNINDEMIELTFRTTTQSILNRFLNSCFQ